MKINIIDIPNWDGARWLGVLYIVDLSFHRPPILGLIFRHEEQATDIFSGWRSLVGREDENEKIRISIIEGDIPGQDFGYTVHITADPDSVFENADQQFDEFDNNQSIFISRVFRMNPNPGSMNLPNFKNAYSRLGEYLLIPVVTSSENISATSIKPLLELGISKHKIIFRNTKDIQRNDIDSVVFTKGL